MEWTRLPISSLGCQSHSRNAAFLPVFFSELLVLTFITSVLAILDWAPPMNHELLKLSLVLSLGLPFVNGPRP